MNDRRTSRGAFTLFELVVAEAVFLILLALIMQFVFGVMKAAQEQKKSMDALGEGRQSLDRLTLDWMARVRRPDVSGTFTKKVGNDELGLLTQVSAYNGVRHLAWVSYQVGLVDQIVGGSQKISSSALQRGILGYNWSSSDAKPANNPLLAFPFTTGPTLASSDYEPMANSVFRMEFCFLQNVPTGSASTTAFNVSNPLNLNSSGLIGIVVAIAGLDQQSRQILTQTQISALSDALPDVTDGQDPQSVWLKTLNDGTFATAAAAKGVPKKAAGAVRVFQRILYVRE